MIGGNGCALLVHSFSWGYQLFWQALPHQISAELRQRMWHRSRRILEGNSVRLEVL